MFIDTYADKDVWYIHTREKKKEILPFATTWMDPEDLILSEISQTEKVIHCMISLLYGKCKNAKLIETEYNIMIVARVETIQEKLMAALYHLSHMSEGKKILFLLLAKAVQVVSDDHLLRSFLL